MDDKKRSGRPNIVTRHGAFPFRTGILTARLVELGIAIDEAFDLAREVRHRITGREEVTTAELGDVVRKVLEKKGYPGVWRDAQEDAPPARPILIATREGVEPYARHTLLQNLVATGVPNEDAIGVADALETALRAEGETVDAEVMDRHVTELLDGVGEAFSRRYTLLRWIRNSEQPVLILLGGATGTGKSTLALQLAHRLGIRRVVSTDMIRETMRAVLSAEVMPGLHDHSFRGMLQGGAVLSDPRERVLAGFRQQAAQVAVCVRAVVRRALRERAHLVLEGTHLAPPFDQFLPPGEYHHAGILLAVPSKKRHRHRFPKRSKAEPGRDAAAYLDAFQSVRWIHDDLLAEAEEHDTLVLRTGDIERTALSALDYLAELLPIRKRTRPPVPVTHEPSVPTLVLVFDGLGDEAHPVLGDQTPLAAATTPTLNALAGTGGQGLIRTSDAEGLLPHTNGGLWALLGLGPSPSHFGRGLCEAMGAGIPLAPGTVYFRGNLATVGEDGAILDRRAGRIASGVQDLLAGLRNVPLAGGLHGDIHPSHEHRVVVVLRGPGLSPQVTDTDPGGGNPIQRVQRPAPTDDSPEAKRTASALRELLDRAAAHLSEHPVNADRVARGMRPANAVITRGAAGAVQLPEPVYTADHAAMVAGCTTALGVGRLLGMQAVRGPRMTGNLATDVDAKFQAVAALLRERSFVVAHFKGADVAAHDRRPLAKRDFIEKVDAALGRFLEANADVAKGLRIVVASDHGTSSRTGVHLPEPVPLLIGTWSGPVEEPAEFDESTAALGALGLLEPGDLADILARR